MRVTLSTVSLTVQFACATSKLGTCIGFYPTTHIPSTLAVLTLGSGPIRYPLCRSNILCNLSDHYSCSVLVLHSMETPMRVDAIRDATEAGGGGSSHESLQNPIVRPPFQQIRIPSIGCFYIFGVQTKLIFIFRSCKDFFPSFCVYISLAYL